MTMSKEMQAPHIFAKKFSQGNSHFSRGLCESPANIKIKLSLGRIATHASNFLMVQLIWLLKLCLCVSLALPELDFHFHER